MSVKFFVDENDLGLGRRLSREQPGVLYPGHPSLPEVERGCLDEDWLQIVGQRNLVVITRDRRIRRRPVEKRMWIQHQVRGFVLTGTASQTTDQSMEVLNKHWERIESTARLRTQDPWMYAVTHAGLREIKLR